jgi:hypothetical protein
MSRWFRVDDALVDDPKVQRLSGDLVKALLNLWCLTSQNDGALPSMDDMAFKLRMKKPQVAAIISELVAAGLVEQNGEFFVPHNWEIRQYRSDANDPTGAKRAKEYRDRKRASRDASRQVTDVTAVRDERQNRADVDQTKPDVRDEAQKRVGDFCQAVVRVYAECNSPVPIETSRCTIWLSQGYDPEVCLAVIASVLARKPSIGSLSYFDQPIADAHAKKAPPRKSLHDGPIEIDWDIACQQWKSIKRWPKGYGNDPESPACRAPPEILRKHGIQPTGASHG